MKRLLTAVITFLGFCALAWGVVNDPIVGLVRHARPSVVRVETIASRESDVVMDEGAGVFITTKGHILTCAHVVAGDPALIQVRLYGSTTTAHPAVLLYQDKTRDLALLKISERQRPYAAAAICLRRPVVGEPVVAIGHPRSEYWSVTSGIISGLNREGTFALNLLQTDAAINSGNSGGPLFAMNGELVGINESYMSGSSCLGFAVPATEIKAFLSVFKGLDEAETKGKGK